MENNNTVFLKNMQNKIDKGEYDKYFKIPFMTKKLFFASLKSRIERRIEKGGTPILTDAEINESIEDVREAAGSTFGVLLHHKILEKTEDETYQISRKGKLALRLNAKYKNI